MRSAVGLSIRVDEDSWGGVPAEAQRKGFGTLVNIEARLVVKGVRKAAGKVDSAGLCRRYCAGFTAIPAWLVRSQRWVEIV